MQKQPIETQTFKINKIRRGKMRKFLASILSVFTVTLLISSVTSAETVQPKTYKVDGENIQIIKNKTADGLNYNTVIGGESNKEAVSKFVEKVIAEESEAKPTPFWEKKCAIKFAEDLGTDARLTVSGTQCTWVTSPLLIYQHNSYEGTQLAAWMGRSPSRADQIVAHQVTTVTGINVSISWPPQFNISSNTGTWDSEPIKDTWIVWIDRPEVSSATSIGGPTIKVEDTVDIYIPGHVYRPQASFEMDPWI
jgi:hypothetical protein